jgi:hypothetical protein
MVLERTQGCGINDPIIFTGLNAYDCDSHQHQGVRAMMETHWDPDSPAFTYSVYAAAYSQHEKVQRAAKAGSA